MPYTVRPTASRLARRALIRSPPDFGSASHYPRPPRLTELDPNVVRPKLVKGMFPGQAQLGPSTHRCQSCQLEGWATPWPGSSVIPCARSTAWSCLLLVVRV